LVKYQVKADNNKDFRGDGGVMIVESEHLVKNIQMNRIPLLNMPPNELINLMPSVRCSAFECEYRIKIEAIGDNKLDRCAVEIPIDVFSLQEYIFNILSPGFPEKKTNSSKSTRNE
jgi:hypothetical protein